MIDAIAITNPIQFILLKCSLKIIKPTNVVVNTIPMLFIGSTILASVNAPSVFNKKKHA